MMHVSMIQDRYTRYSPKSLWGLTLMNGKMLNYILHPISWPVFDHGRRWRWERAARALSLIHNAAPLCRRTLRMMIYFSETRWID